MATDLSTFIERGGYLDCSCSWGTPQQQEPTGPTGRLRMLQTKTETRLQQELLSATGLIWVDVPVVEADVLPPRTNTKNG